jgi:hypothetical protein
MNVRDPPARATYGIQMSDGTNRMGKFSETATWILYNEKRGAAVSKFSETATWILTMEKEVLLRDDRAVRNPESRHGGFIYVRRS